MSLWNLDNTAESAAGTVQALAQFPRPHKGKPRWFLPLLSHCLRTNPNPAGVRSGAETGIIAIRDVQRGTRARPKSFWQTLHICREPSVRNDLGNQEAQNFGRRPESGRPSQHFSNFNVHMNPLKIGFKCRFSGGMSGAPESTFLRIPQVMLTPGLFCE